jgi:PTH1 family peptidyl-tRNA hydrolase
MRMRIGVGHPGHKSQVTNFVLKPPGKAEQTLIDGALPDAQRAVELLLSDGPEKAMHFLHTD